MTTETRDEGAPAYSYGYGNLEGGQAFTIDVWPPGPDRYQARAWTDGDTSDVEYFDTFADCVAWFRTFDNQWTTEHELPALGLAPQWNTETQDWHWTLYDATNVEDWWIGSDSEHSPHPDFIPFDTMTEDPSLDATHYPARSDAPAPAV